MGGATTADDFLADNQSAASTLIEPGTVPTAQTLDAQVGYILKPLYTTVHAVGTNLLDAPDLQVYGASNYGRLVYVGLLFDIK